jgi:hypothetical protein
MSWINPGISVFSQILVSYDNAVEFNKSSHLLTETSFDKLFKNSYLFPGKKTDVLTRFHALPKRVITRFHG